MLLSALANGMAWIILMYVVSLAFITGLWIGGHNKLTYNYDRIYDNLKYSKELAEQLLARSTGIMRRTIKIELKADLSDEQYEAMKKALKASLRMVLATASMISANSPSIAMTGEDFFTAPEEIEFDLAGDDGD